MAEKPTVKIAAENAEAAAAEPSLDAVREDLEKLRADFASLIETLGRTAKHGVEGAAGEAGSAAADVSDWAEGQYLTLRETIREKPVTACAIAAGVGVILGQILLRR